MTGKIWILYLVFFSALGKLEAEEPWHHPLYMANQDYWRERIPVEVTNSSSRDIYGEPLSLIIGNAPEQLLLTKADANSIRVVDSKGNELLWRINLPGGKYLTKGIIPDGGEFIFPVTQSAGSTETYYIYYNNPSAWPVADILESHHGVVNGGFEIEEEGNPFGWRMDWPSTGRKIEWTHDKPLAGRYCICISQTSPDEKNEKAGFLQRDIHIRGGNKYRIEAWIKAENVDGNAGFRILVGNKVSYDKDFTLLEDTLSGGKGTYEWKKVSIEFTAPLNANSARIYSVLEGKGTVWFDEIRIHCLENLMLTTKFKPVQTLQLKTNDIPTEWPQDKEWDIRIPVKTMNLQDHEITGIPVYVDMKQINARLFDKINNTTPATLMEKNRFKPMSLFKNGVLFEGRLPAHSSHTSYLYFAGNGNPEFNSSQIEYSDWVHDKRNLVLDPCIEYGLTYWKRSQQENIPGDKMDDAYLKTYEPGQKHLYIHSDRDMEIKEAGWKQDLSILPGKTYFFSARVKCADVINGKVFIKVHFPGARGELLHRTTYSDMIRGTTDWTVLSGFFRVPDDVFTARISPMLEGPGKVWFDDILAIEVIEGTSSSLFFDQRRALEPFEFDAWPVNPIIKVFNEDLPPENVPSARISAARNEFEPVQIAIRSPIDYENLEVRIVPPSDKDGNQLDQVTTSVAGYVAVNYPTNYFRTEAPAWHLKYPDGEIGSDGWTGFWPDPLLPLETFHLPSNSTQSLWIDIYIPEGAKEGDYYGAVKFYHEDDLIKEIPWTVHVWDFTLSRNKSFGATFDFRFPHQLRDPGPDLFRNDLSRNDFRNMYWSFMADHNINGGEILPPPMIYFDNGHLTADFSEYDKAASFYFDELNLPFAYTPAELFYLFGWSEPPEKKFGENPYPGVYPYENADRSQLRPEFKKAYQRVLQTYWDHMKEKGWAEKMILYMADEPYQGENSNLDINGQVKALCNMIHEVDPDIPIYTSTWWFHPEWEDYIDIWGLTAFGVAWEQQPVPPEDLRRLTDSGKRIWFTSDGQMCTDTPYLAVERLLPYYSFKYGAEAYEFWGVNWLTFNPYEYGWHSYIFQSQAPGEAFWIRYPNGDGYVLYPGKPIGHDGPVASIRLKQVREGITDYEYLSLLDQFIKQADPAKEIVKEARRVLKEALDLVNIPVENTSNLPVEVQIFNGRYSTLMLKNPDDVFRIRERIGNCIEKLGGEK